MKERGLLAAMGLWILVAPFAVVAAQPAAPRATISEDLRLDANAEDFPRIRSLYVSPRGDIVVAVLPDMQLRVYAASGNRIAVVGRRGRGPGEFTSFSWMGWKVDTLWAADDGQRRISYFGADYVLDRTTANSTFDLPRTKAEHDSALAAAVARGAVGIPLSRIYPMGVNPDGSILAMATKPVTDNKPNRRGYGGDPELVRVSADGSARRHIVDPPWSGDERWSIGADGFGRSIPFSARPVFTISSTSDRVAYMWSVVTSATGGTFTVAAFRTTGQRMFERTFPFAGVAIPTAARDSAIEANGPQPGPGGRPSEISENTARRFQELAREKMPTIYAGVESLIVGLDNTVWVGLRRTPEGQPFLVLNARGDPIASILLPANSILRQASTTRLYMTETDADGLVSVVRYRVTGINCGPPGCR